MMRQGLGRFLGRLLPAGVLGLSAALAPCAAAVVHPPVPPAAQAEADMAARLSAVRVAFSAALPALPAADPAQAEVQRVWWGNGGWGRRRWGWGGGWGNGGWGGGWHNGGWGNGGWRNGGWGNGGWGNWHP